MALGGFLFIVTIIAVLVGVAITSLEKKYNPEMRDINLQSALRVRRVVTLTVASAPIFELACIGVLLFLEFSMERIATTWSSPAWLGWILLIAIAFSINLGLLGGLLLALKRRNFNWLIIPLSTVLITMFLLMFIMALATNPVG